MSRAWLNERKHDFYYRKAKEEKYRSRAAYKLLQCNAKYRFLNKGQIVVDLGAAPGGWLQASRKLVGKEGLVVGVDLKEIVPLPFTNIVSVVGDIRENETHNSIEEILPGSADAVVSDVSPNVSGVWEVDHARQIDLARNSLKIALKVLRTNGNFFVKVFQGDMFQGFVEEVKRYFDRVEIIKPRASRSKSSEVFVLGMGLKV
ncbi:MAG: RlmE family RNA methyltransferase [Candidatus Bathyarchaeota archaeon]|nr:MAG: RlmE family RNA methyltransferase [Candidatus Bathyarchaeota archaeon]